MMGEIRNIRPETPNARNFMSSGGGGTHDGLEPRVAKLEAHIEHIMKAVDEIKDSVKSSGEKISDIRIDMGKIDVKLDHKPSKRYTVTTICLASAFATAILHLLNIFHVAH